MYTKALFCFVFSKSFSNLQDWVLHDRVHKIRTENIMKPDLINPVYCPFTCVSFSSQQPSQDCKSWFASSLFRLPLGS